MSCKKSVVDKDDELDELVEDDEDDDEEVATAYAELTDDIVMTRDVLNSGGLSALRFRRDVRSLLASVIDTNRRNDSGAVFRRRSFNQSARQRFPASPQSKLDTISALRNANVERAVLRSAADGVTLAVSDSGRQTNAYAKASFVSYEARL